jgi:hypothetical protein
MTPAPNPEPAFPIQAVRGLGMGLAGAPKAGAGMYRAGPAPPGRPAPPAGGRYSHFPVLRGSESRA